MTLLEIKAALKNLVGKADFTAAMNTLTAWAVGKFATKSENAAVSDRITQIEANEGALILGVDFETGQLVQVGSVNGTFGVDYTTGYLTFTPAPTQSEEESEEETE